MNNSITLEIILNKHAGNGQSIKNWKKVKDYLEDEKVDYNVHLTDKKFGARKIATNLANSLTDNKKILVLGGDGTLNQVLNGVKNSKNPETPIAYLPAGSGNDFSRGIKIKNLDTIDALKQIIKMDNPLKIDIGKASSKDSVNYFLNNIGIGFDARTVFYTNNSKRKSFFNKLNIGSLAYVSSLLRVLKNQKGFSIVVKDSNNNDIEFNNAYIVTATNHPYFGGGIAIDPKASPFDQKLDLVVVNKISGLTFVKLFRKLLTNGSHLDDEDVWLLQENNFTLKNNQKQYGQMDGEELGNKNFDLKFEVSSHHFWIPIKKEA
ncbi:diacylglycerol/lipid kinase family protein [Companilactobacillus metriopterae]|uniref:diacylglycerol/lipid kinase family protein n=1 Tax=Companilactobacillus metriopterae TaxID=1909267 RepID=UPI00100AB990|nr:diacylglycerol kinase family protein [Companilactobacillus metriopterae]